MWPQAGPAFLASLFSSVKWDFRPKALGDLVHPQGRIISRKLSLVFGWLLLSGPPLCTGLEGDKGEGQWMEEQCEPRLPAGDRN